jgi:hypothetical protein
VALSFAKRSKKYIHLKKKTERPTRDDKICLYVRYHNACNFMWKYSPYLSSVFYLILSNFTGYFCSVDRSKDIYFVRGRHACQPCMSPSKKSERNKISHGILMDRVGSSSDQIILFYYFLIWYELDASKFESENFNPYPIWSGHGSTRPDLCKIIN